ncbi:MAG: pyridoxal-phosphate dependent enzyme, partial [Proteobacteria bacterium]|nr:pyridoxal-phosphate dependent enzyme [Pseudomonadota bacterium]
MSAGGTYAVTGADIASAAARIAPFVIRTPAIAGAAVSALVGRPVTFKCESMQRTGSFKIRGATNAVRSIADADAP